MKRLPILGMMAVLLLSSQIAWGAVPQLINFQGVLKDNGQPVSNGSHSMTFAIYSASTGGSPLWTETQSVTTSGGHFAVLLGSVTPIPNSVFNASDRYLGITVPPDPELSPRQRLASVSFSYRVSTVDGASGGTIEGSLHLGTADTLFASNVSSNSPLRLQTAGTTRVYVDGATGNVGIGTTSPANVLDIQGSGGERGITVRESDGGGNGAILNANADRGYLQLLQSGVPRIELNAYPGAPQIFNNGGKVGIGTNDPPNELYVVGNAGVSGDGGFGGLLTVTGDVWMNSGAQILNNLNVGGSMCAGGSLFVQGAIWPGAACGQPSDRRYKTAIVPLEHVLDKLAGLHGVHFEWNEQFRTEHPQAAGKQIGVIAQEVEKEFPELVSTMPDGYKAVDYGKLSSVLLEAIKEQQKEIDTLRESVEKLRAERK